VDCGFQGLDRRAWGVAVQWIQSLFHKMVSSDGGWRCCLQNTLSAYLPQKVNVVHFMLGVFYCIYKNRVKQRPSLKMRGVEGGDLWSVGQIPPAICFCIDLELRMIFMFCLFLRQGLTM
jgi:hypothetical protein